MIVTGPSFTSSNAIRTPERPPLDRNALVGQRVAEAVVERLGELGRSGLEERLRELAAAD